MWSISAESYPYHDVKHSFRVSKYKKHFDKIIHGDVDFSQDMRIDDIFNFE